MTVALWLNIDLPYAVHCKVGRLGRYPSNSGVATVSGCRQVGLDHWNVARWNLLGFVRHVNPTLALSAFDNPTNDKQPNRTLLGRTMSITDIASAARTDQRHNARTHMGGHSHDRAGFLSNSSAL
jgi:hypothetical protein